MKMSKIMTAKEWKIARPHSNWTEGKNTDTTREGYFIEHAGSLWAGQANSQNKLEELYKVAEVHGFDTRMGGIEVIPEGVKFWGNMYTISNSFSVIIWDKEKAEEARRMFNKYAINPGESIFGK